MFIYCYTLKLKKIFIIIDSVDKLLNDEKFLKICNFLKFLEYNS